MAVQQDVNLISKPTLAELEDNVRTNKWEAVGVQLKLDDTSLQEIRSQTSHDIGDGRRRMFRLWLYSHPNPTRKQLLDVLRKMSVAEFRIASAYEEYILQLPQATTTFGITYNFNYIYIYIIIITYVHIHFILPFFFFVAPTDMAVQYKVSPTESTTSDRCM